MAFDVFTQTMVCDEAEGPMSHKLVYSTKFQMHK